MESYFRGTGFQTKENCLRVNDLCEECEKWWYIRCGPGYTVTPDCKRCEKKIEKPIKKKSRFSTFIVYTVIIVIIISLIYHLLTYQYTYTRNTVEDIILGTPGSSDSYAVLERITSGSENKIYV